MGKYTEESRELLKCVGGKENIAAVSHCVTRMRFVLKDPGKADKAAIEKLPTVKGTFTQAGQFQVIIGNVVSTYYNDFVAGGRHVQGCGEGCGKAEPERAPAADDQLGGDICAADSGDYRGRSDTRFSQHYRRDCTV